MGLAGYTIGHMANPDTTRAWDDTVLPQYEPRPTGSVRFQVARRRRTEVSMRMLVIGIVIVLGIVVIGVGTMRWRHQVAIEEAEQARLADLQARQQREEQMRREALEREARLEAERTRIDAQRIQAYADQQRAAEEARRAEADAAARKEQAWAKFYRVPPLCQSAATMACTNAYIRAKREFEARYDKGQL